MKIFALCPHLDKVRTQAYKTNRGQDAPTATAQNAHRDGQKADFLQVDRTGPPTAGRDEASPTAGRDAGNRTRQAKRHTPPPHTTQAMPLTPTKIRTIFLEKSCPLPRNIWKFSELVSEIPRGRRNRTKKSLEMGIKSPRTEEERGKMGRLYPF